MSTSYQKGSIMFYHVKELQLKKLLKLNRASKRVINKNLNSIKPTIVRTRIQSALSSVQSGYEARVVPISKPMQSSQLMKLFEDELRDIYWVERALSHAIPKMMKNATSHELLQALTSHLAATDHQMLRVERVFESLEKKPVARRCLAIEGLLKEVGEMMESCDPGAMCDTGIITAEQKIQGYEVSSYETLRQFAETLVLFDAVDMFETTLDEQKASIERFAGVSVSAIQVYENIEEGEDESEFGYEQRPHFHVV